jgi:anti-sigma regulatory factor (Ser/Thr protein kinase)
VSEVAGEPEIRVMLPRSPEAGAVARGLISRHFAVLLRGESLLHAKLVASELVNNAYQHGRGQIRLEVRRRGDRLRIEVVDEGRDAAVRITDRPSLLGGRGLRLVDTLTLSWGVNRGTTHVWADLPL